MILLWKQEGFYLHPEGSRYANIFGYNESFGPVMIYSDGPLITSVRLQFDNGSAIDRCYHAEFSHSETHKFTL